MNYKKVLGTTVATLGIALAGAPLAHAGGMAPHEKSYAGPEGFAMTVGHTDQSFRPVPPLNGMPTNREVYLDNTFYGEVPADAFGTLKAGYFVSCAVDLDLSVTVDASVGLDAGVTIGVGSSGKPSVNAQIGPDFSAGIGLNMSLTPGEIRDVEVGTKELSPGSTGYLVSHDFHLLVMNCAGPLTIRSYVTIAAESPQVTAGDAVFGDTIFL